MTPLFLAVMAGVGLLGTTAGEDAGASLGPPSFDDAVAQDNGGPPPPPPAATTISSEVMVLHATNDNSGIDPKLGRMPVLSKPPFSSYNSYRLIERTAMPLRRGDAAPLKLPTGRVLRVIYKDTIQPQKPGDSVRYVVSASIQSANGKSFLPLVEVNAKPGEWFWVGGQDYKGGSLFIGIKVSP